MTTSGVKKFSQTTQELIEDAFDELGLLSEGRSLSANQFKKAKRKLNAMIQTWQSKLNVNVWKNTEATLFLSKGQPIYQLGNNQANATESFVETTINANALSGASTIDVASIAGIASGDHILIVLNNGNLQSNTVNGAPAGNTVTLTNTLTDDVNIGNAIVAFTTKITKPLRITQVQFNGSVGQGGDIWNLHFSRDEYFRLSDKDTLGAATQYYYNVNIDDVTFYVWSAPATSLDRIKFTYQPEFDLFINNDDTPDFAPEWYETLVYNLSEKLGVSQGMAGTDTYKKVAAIAADLHKDMVKSTRPARIVKVTTEYDDLEGYY